MRGTCDFSSIFCPLILEVYYTSGGILFVEISQTQLLECLGEREVLAYIAVCHSCSEVRRLQGASRMHADSCLTCTSCLQRRCPVL
jgi:hypothetical protein